MTENKENPILEETESTEIKETTETVFEETTEETPETEEYFERQYFGGDSLKEEADDEEYLRAFDKANKSETKKGGKGLKKQAIIIAAVFAVAVILFGVYLFVLKPNSTESNSTDLYVLSASCVETVGNVTDNVTISFKDTEATLSGSTYGVYIYRFAKSFAYYFENVKTEYGVGTDFCTVSSEKGKTVITESEFFNTLEDGTRYSFNGETVFGSAILEVTGNSALKKDDSFTVWALDGYNIDGDRLVNNRPFMYPSVERSNIDSIEITNSNGYFKLYRIHSGDDVSSDFYFEGCEACETDAELLASLIVNCRYVLAQTKISGVTDYKPYGLDGENGYNATVKLTTLDGTVHTFYIGDEVPSSNSYYARYEGKSGVYILDSSYKDTVLATEKEFIKAGLGYVVSSTNAVYYITDLYIHYRDVGESGTDVYVTQKRDVVASSNITNYNTEQTLTTVIHDKTRFTGEYSNWTENDTLIGIKPSDSKSIGVQLQLTNYALNTNEYSVAFGLVKDSSNKAVMPTEVTISVYDSDLANEEGNTNPYVTVVSSKVFDQTENSYKLYKFDFTYEKQVKYIKVMFTVPDGWLVTDEITAYADGKDAIPNEGITGIWKIVSPESFVAEGTNYSVPDTSAFSDILNGISTLVGDEVVETRIYDGDNAAAMEKLKKYGLDDPASTVYYSYTDPSTKYVYESYIYFSDLNVGETPDDRFYYAYANVRVTADTGEKYSLSTNIVAKIGYDTAYYMSWDYTTLLDRAAFSMYIDKIDTIEMSFGDENYLFDLQDTDGNGKLDTVLMNGTEVLTQNFRKVYLRVLECTRAGLYTPKEGDLSEDNLIFTFTMHSDLKDTEIKFYRVSSTKVIYSTNGQYSEFYVLYSSVSSIINDIHRMINGEIIEE